MILSFRRFWEVCFFQKKKSNHNVLLIPFSKHASRSGISCCASILLRSITLVLKELCLMFLLRRLLASPWHIPLHVVRIMAPLSSIHCVLVLHIRSTYSRRRVYHIYMTPGRYCMLSCWSSRFGVLHAVRNIATAACCTYCHCPPALQSAPEYCVLHRRAPLADNRGGAGSDARCGADYHSTETAVAAVAAANIWNKAQAPGQARHAMCTRISYCQGPRRAWCTLFVFFNHFT